MSLNGRRVSMRVRGILLFILCVCSFFASAADGSVGSRKKVMYTGQEREFIELERMISITRYRQEQYQGVCSRSVPYVVNECNYETRYREVCHFEPGHNQCRTRNERECHFETRYRQECHQGAGRRVCHHVPGREVCRQEPGRRVCRTRNGQRRCHQEPGRRVCHREPGRQVCENQPGRRICNQVPYQERVCRTVPRRHCVWMPGRNVCHQEPYSERVCRDVTRYRDEEYSCMRTRDVPYQVKVKSVAQFDVYFHQSNKMSSGVPFIFKLNAQGKVVVKLPKTDDLLIEKSEQLTFDESGDEFYTDGQVDINLLSKNRVLEIVNTPVRLTRFTPSMLAFKLGRPHHLAQLSFKLTIIRQRRTLHDKVIFQRALHQDEYTLDANGKLKVNLIPSGVKIKNKSHRIILEVIANVDRNIDIEQHIFSTKGEFVERP